MAAQTIDALDYLEGVANDALYKVERAWKFVLDVDPPEHLERSIRAAVLGGADPALLVGAFVIAAQKRGLHNDDLWTYATGVVRNTMSHRDEQDTAVAEVMGAPEPAPTWRSWFKR